MIKTIYSIQLFLNTFLNDDYKFIKILLKYNFYHHKMFIL